MSEKEYDFLILGAGVTGMAAAMYSARLGMKTLVLGFSHGTELPVGGVITTTNLVENYPGFTRLTGTELAENIEKHARSYDLVQIKSERADEIKKVGKIFEVKTKKGSYKTRALLFATGTKWRKLEVPGAKEFENRGVVYCALCDSPLFKNKIVAVIGGSDSAAKDALVAAEHAKKVYIIYRGEKIRAEIPNLKRIEANKKIEIITNTNVLEVKGEKAVRSVMLDKEYGGKKELMLDGIFVAIGHLPLSDLAKTLGVKTNEKGEIIMNHKTSETNISAVYAAGDVGDKPFKQAITGVAEGCTAAYSAYTFLGNQTA